MKLEKVTNLVQLYKVLQHRRGLCTLYRNISVLKKSVGQAWLLNEQNLNSPSWTTQGCGILELGHTVSSEALEKGNRLNTVVSIISWWCSGALVPRFPSSKKLYYGCSTHSDFKCKKYLTAVLLPVLAWLRQDSNKFMIGLGHLRTLLSQNKKKRVGVEMIECLLSIWQGLSSTPTTEKSTQLAIKSVLVQDNRSIFASRVRTLSKQEML